MKPYRGPRRRIRHDELTAWQESLRILKTLDSDFHATVLQYWGRVAWSAKIPRCVFARRHARDHARVALALAQYAPSEDER